MSDFIDGSDLYTLWRMEEKLDETTVKLYSAELALTLGGYDNYHDRVAFV